jgi:hypothetical protein
LSAACIAQVEVWHLRGIEDLITIAISERACFMPRKRGEGCVSCRFLGLFELNQIVGHLAGGLIFISESARGGRPLTFVMALSETLAKFSDCIIRLGPVCRRPVMKRRRRFKQINSLEERPVQEAERLREEAKKLPPSFQRETLLRKARQAETGSHVSEWLGSSGLQKPK